MKFILEINILFFLKIAIESQFHDQKHKYLTRYTIKTQSMQTTRNSLFSPCRVESGYKTSIHDP